MRQVRLHDGTLVDASSEEWRHECEARHIMNLRTLRERRRWLADIEAKRGEAARRRLERTIMALWKQRGRQNDSSGT